LLSRESAEKFLGGGAKDKTKKLYQDSYPS